MPKKRKKIEMVGKWKEEKFVLVQPELVTDCSRDARTNDAQLPCVHCGHLTRLRCYGCAVAAFEGHGRYFFEFSQYMPVCSCCEVEHDRAHDGKFTDHQPIYGMLSFHKKPTSEELARGRLV